MMAHVAEYKKKKVAELAKLMKDYPIIGIANMENMPTPQLQKIRAQIRGNVVLTMSKKTLITLAIEKAKKDKPGIENLEQFLSGMPALMFTKENPFKLYNMLNKKKTPAPAKAGQVAPKDIIIEAGPTPFAPGPIIGELSMIGVKSGVDSGKVAIKQDSVVAKKGERIKPKVAEILTRLGIKPMEIGLDLVATFENGILFTKDVLFIDEKEFESKVVTSHTWAVNLAVEAGYPTKEIIGIIFSKALNDAKALAISECIVADGVMEDLIAKAEREMLGVKEEAKL
jgi:large subunit ribosomal protein L10